MPSSSSWKSWEISAWRQGQADLLVMAVPLAKVNGEGRVETVGAL